MRIHRSMLSILTVVAILAGFALAADQPVAWWNLGEKTGDTVNDQIGNVDDDILGNYDWIKGVEAGGVKFDGFTTRIIRDAKSAPKLSGAFAVEAWIAPQAYPWSWCAIISKEQDRKKGFVLGLDELGHIGLQVAVGKKWITVKSDEGIPFMEAWSHIVGTFDPKVGLTVYINGEKAGHTRAKGKMIAAKKADVQIGRNQTFLPPAALVREHVSFPAIYSYDGIIDEVKIYNSALSAEDIKGAYDSSKPDGPPALEWRKLPQLQAGPTRFGAVYNTLEFYKEWDALWPVGQHADITVSFDKIDGKMVFWRGTNYNMNLVTENGRWVGDQSGEGGNGDVIGCCEHMSDKQCRYTHVRLIESNDARVVVHWRYAITDVLYRIASVDPITNWGDWADEYYYIYPDGVAVRAVKIYGHAPGYSITEPATYNQPGEKAEDNVELAAATLANMDGVIRTYSWDPWPGSGDIAADFGNPVPNANIAVVNFKSTNKPFYIFEPGTRIIPYGGGLVELRTDYSKFPTWNHWPVAQVPSDGRYALAPDRVSSSAILSPEPKMVRRVPGGPLEGRFIMGLTDSAIEKLAPLARSWLQTPELANVSAGYTNEGYSRDERAFVLEKSESAKAGLKFEIAASNDSPIVNPAFVIKNWGITDAALKIDGKSVARGKQFRYGHTSTTEGYDLIVWLDFETDKPTRIELNQQ